jgi:serine/threonine protein phosphatase PrpC
MVSGSKREYGPWPSTDRGGELALAWPAAKRERRDPAASVLEGAEEQAALFRWLMSYVRAVTYDSPAPSALRFIVQCRTELGRRHACRAKEGWLVAHWVLCWRASLPSSPVKQPFLAMSLHNSVAGAGAQARLRPAATKPVSTQRGGATERAKKRRQGHEGEGREGYEGRRRSGSADSGAWDGRRLLLHSAHRPHFSKRELDVAPDYAQHTCSASSHAGNETSLALPEGGDWRETEWFRAADAAGSDAVGPAGNDTAGKGAGGERAAECRAQCHAAGQDYTVAAAGVGGHPMQALLGVFDGHGPDGEHHAFVGGRLLTRRLLAAWPEYQVLLLRRVRAREGQKAPQKEGQQAGQQEGLEGSESGSAAAAAEAGAVEAEEAVDVGIEAVTRRCYLGTQEALTGGAFPHCSAGSGTTAAAALVVVVAHAGREHRFLVSTNAGDSQVLWSATGGGAAGEKGEKGEASQRHAGGEHDECAGDGHCAPADGQYEECSLDHNCDSMEAVRLYLGRLSAQRRALRQRQEAAAVDAAKCKASRQRPKGGAKGNKGTGRGTGKSRGFPRRANRAERRAAAEAEGRVQALAREGTRYEPRPVYYSRMNCGGSGFTMPQIHDAYGRPEPLPVYRYEGPERDQVALDHDSFERMAMHVQGVGVQSRRTPPTYRRPSDDKLVAKPGHEHENWGSTLGGHGQCLNGLGDADSGVHGSAVPHVSVRRVDGPGRLLVGSDGLTDLFRFGPLMRWCREHGGAPDALKRLYEHVFDTAAADQHGGYPARADALGRLYPRWDDVSGVLACLPGMPAAEHEHEQPLQEEEAGPVECASS